MEQTFTVIDIDKNEGETQIHMQSERGDRLRFFAGKQAWTFRTFVTGAISKKQLNTIVDAWYVIEKKMFVNIGDSVTA